MHWHKDTLLQHSLWKVRASQFRVTVVLEKKIFWFKFKFKFNTKCRPQNDICKILKSLSK